MREIKTKVKLWNFLDEDKVREDKIKPIKCDGIVDIGAISISLPKVIVDELKLVKEERKVPVRYADGRFEEREVAIGLRVEIMGRKGLQTAIIEPNGDEILLGMLLLEQLDLFINTKDGKLIPNPESPDRPLYKMR